MKSGWQELEECCQECYRPASQPEKELRHGESSIPVSYFKHGVGEKIGYFIFSTSKLEGKERKRKIKELTEFLIYIKSNGREDLIAITHLELS